MGLFNSVDKEKLEKMEAEHKKELKNLRLRHRLVTGRLRKQVVTRDATIEKLEHKLATVKDISDQKLADLEKQRDYYQELEINADAVEKSMREVKLAKVDLKADQDELFHREERLKRRFSLLEEEENQQYKAGYSDGLADGLRKAHDITREDRKYLTMIAMSTNQSNAIKEASKLLKEGGDDYKADSKSK